MIVYGDREFRIKLREMLSRLRNQIQRIRGRDLDKLRALLIITGQLEQAVEDHWSQPGAESEAVTSCAQNITDRAAAAFYVAWAGCKEGLEFVPSICELLDWLNNFSEVDLAVKVPEGYEFYALYPDQYCASALRWAEEHASALPKRAAVAGIRSICTGLSAVVQTALEHAGWEIHRFTVRPSGDPFRRKAALRREDLRLAEWALIVDEGPGLSGSSMASVAEALAETGMPRDRIAFFPGHEGEPGPAASEWILRWWSSVPRYFTPLEDLR